MFNNILPVIILLLQTTVTNVNESFPNSRPTSESGLLSSYHELKPTGCFDWDNISIISFSSHYEHAKETR